MEKLCKMIIDGAEMIIPENYCTWTMVGGKPKRIFTLCGGYAMCEFDGLWHLPMEERITIIERRRRNAERERAN